VVPGVSLTDALSKRPGLADELLSTLEARALWSHYGF